MLPTIIRTFFYNAIKEKKEEEEVRTINLNSSTYLFPTSVIMPNGAHGSLKTKRWH